MVPHTIVPGVGLVIREVFGADVLQLKWKTELGINLWAHHAMVLRVASVVHGRENDRRGVRKWAALYQLFFHGLPLAAVVREAVDARLERSVEEVERLLALLVQSGHVWQREQVSGDSVGEQELDRDCWQYALGFLGQIGCR